MHHGEIVEVGPPEQLYNQPKRAETMRHLGFPQTNFMQASSCHEQWQRESGHAFI